MIQCFYTDHDLQSNHTLGHVHASPCKTIPLLSELAEPRALKKKKKKILGHRNRLRNTLFLVF